MESRRDGTLFDLATELEEAAAILDEVSGALRHLGVPPTALGADGPGRPAELGRALAADWLAAIDTRGREAAAAGERLTDLAAGIRAAAAGYADTDAETAQRSSAAGSVRPGWSDLTAGG